jgi:hypothetical protein
MARSLLSHQSTTTNKPFGRARMDVSKFHMGEASNGMEGIAITISNHRPCQQRYHHHLFQPSSILDLRPALVQLHRNDRVGLSADLARKHDLKVLDRQEGSRLGIGAYLGDSNGRRRHSRPPFGTMLYIIGNDHWRALGKCWHGVSNA